MNISSTVQIYCSKREGRPGFTLVEIIVALTMVSVALSIFIAMFVSAVRLAAESRDKTIALEVAETYLHLLNTSPDAFCWQTNTPNEHGLFAIDCEKTGPLHSGMPPLPETNLATRNAHERILSLYNKFRCKAWGRLPSPDAASYEITVSVSWYTQGRPYLFALSSSIARSRVDTATAPPGEKKGEGL